MRKQMLRSLSVLLLLALLVCLVGAATAGAAEGNALSVTYTFTGIMAGTPGFAQGEIRIQPGDGGRSSGYYLLYYADDTETLKAYDELASVRITGKAVTYQVKSGLMLPVGATRIAVFESTSRFLDETPSVKDAAAVVEIPAEKRLSDLGAPELSFGAVSDVHMNYEAHDRGAYQKWADALEFFSASGMEYVIVSGDMTGDDGGGEDLEADYQKYVEIINASSFPIENIYESLGNHGNTPAKLALFNKYTSGEGEVHPFEGSPYYSVLLEGKDGARDTLFLFMRQELSAPGESASRDNFSKAQIDWLEGMLQQYGETETNIFIVEHSPFLEVGPGDKFPRGYTAMLSFKASFTQNMRFKALLETYKNVIVMSGHTHLSLYDNYNYSNEDGAFANMVHIGSTSQPCAYGAGSSFVRSSDGRYGVTPTYGSEGYLVRVYGDYITYTGYNLSTGKIIPAGCLIIPTVAPEPVAAALGDINGNGEIDGTDYALLKRFCLGTYTFTKEQQAVADINRDGKIDGMDYALVKRHVLGTYVIG